MTPPAFNRILVAVKPRGLEALLVMQRAQRLAHDLGAEVALTTCVHDAPVALGLTLKSQAAKTARQALLDREREKLERLARPLRKAGIHVTTRPVWHSPVYEGILAEVRKWRADLLVVGVHEPRLVPHTVLVDTDWQLIRLCPCPLLIVKEPDIAHYDTVLVALDPLHAHEEPEGFDGVLLESAVALSRPLRADLRVVHAFPDPAEFALATSIEVQPGVWYGTESIERVHRKALTELLNEYGLGADRADLLPGDPAEVITEVAASRNAQLLVVGALKRGRLRQAALGSTAERVAAGAACDVLLVKPP